jgi:hypothetical protein
MARKNFGWLAAVGVAMTLVQVQAQDALPPIDMQKAAEQLSSAMQKMQQSANKGEPVTVVDFRKLKELLPESLPGMKRMEAKGQKTSQMGISCSQATGEYSAEDAGSAQIEIMDSGSMKGFMQFGAGLMGEVDNETETGYERTVTVQGYKGVESFDGENKSGDLKLFVEGRFMVTIEVSDVAKGDFLQAAAAKIDLKKLAALK